MRKATVDLRAHGTVMVPDKWTEDEIENDATGFDEAILEALPDNMNTLTFEVEDAFTEETSVS